VGGWDEVDQDTFPDPACWTGRDHRSLTRPRYLDAALHAFMTDASLPALERLEAAQEEAGWHGADAGELRHWYQCTAPLLLSLFTTGPIDWAEITVAREVARRAAPDAIFVDGTHGGWEEHSEKWNACLQELHTALASRSDIEPYVLDAWTTLVFPSWSYYARQCRYTPEPRVTVSTQCEVCTWMSNDAVRDRPYAFCLPDNANVPLGSSVAYRTAYQKAARTETTPATSVETEPSVRDRNQRRPRFARGGAYCRGVHPRSTISSGPERSTTATGCTSCGTPRCLTRCRRGSRTTTLTATCGWRNPSIAPSLQETVASLEDHSLHGDLARNPSLTPAIQSRFAKDSDAGIRSGIASIHALLTELQWQLLDDPEHWGCPGSGPEPVLVPDVQRTYFTRRTDLPIVLAGNPALTRELQADLVQSDEPNVRRSLAHDYCITRETRKLLAQSSEAVIRALNETVERAQLPPRVFRQQQDRGYDAVLAFLSTLDAERVPNGTAWPQRLSLGLRSRPKMPAVRLEIRDRFAVVPRMLNAH
jgi:hypothetical protein